MADRLVRSKTTYQTSGTSITATFTETTPLDGTYLLVASIHLANATAIAAPSGWTEISGGGASGASQTRMYVKQGDGTTNGVTLTLTSASATLIISAYSGFVSTTPLWSLAGAGSAGTATASTVPAGYAYGVIIAGVGLSATTSTWGAWTNASRIGSIVSNSQLQDGARAEYTGSAVNIGVAWSDTRTPRFVGVVMPLKETPSSPEMAFAFSEGTGTTSADTSGHNHTATNIPSWSTGGHFGKAAVSSASSSAARLTGLSITGNSSRTWMTWFKLTTMPASDNYAIPLGYQEASGGGYSIIYVNNSGQIGLSGSNHAAAQTWETESAAGIIVADAWYHAALVYDSPASQVSLYLNGALLLTAEISDTPADIAYLSVGGTDDDLLAGQFIDDFRQFETSLSLWEVQHFMYTPVTETTDSPDIIGVASGGIVGSGSFNIVPPAGAGGYLAIVSTGTSSPGADVAPDPTPPAGFTLYQSGNNSYTAWRIYTGAPGAGSNWQTTAGWSTSVMVVGLTNFTIDAYANGGAQNTNPTPDQTAPSVTTTGPALTMRIMTSAPWPGTPSATGVVNAPNDHYTHFIPNGDEGTLVAIATSDQAAAGSTGTAAFDFTPLDGSTVHTLALKKVTRSITYFDTAWNTTGTGTGDGETKYKQVTLAGCQPGDVVLAFGITENYLNGGATRYMWDVTPGGVKTGAGGAVTDDLLPGQNNDVDFYAGYTPVVSAGDITIQIGLRYTDSGLMGVGAYLIPAELVTGGYGFTGGLVGSEDGLTSLTFPSNSTVIYMGGNWDPTSMGTTTTPSGGTVLRSHLSAGAYSTWTALWQNQSAGTRNYGPSGLSAEDVTGIAFVMTSTAPTSSRWYSGSGTPLTPYRLTGSGLIELE